MEKITLYIPCYNAERFIRKCIESVLSQTYPVDELLIIDDGSTDTTVEVASRYPVRILKHASRRGVGAARNTAFKNARNEFVAALDSDCVAAPDWLEKLMNDSSESTVAGAGGRLIGCKFSIADKWRESHMIQDWGSQKMENPVFLYGSNTVYRKSIITKIGLYNELYTTNYEDCDVSRRLMQRGFRLIYNPSATATHLRRDSVKSVITSYWNWCFYVRPQLISLNNLIRKIKENYGLSWYFCRTDIRNHHYALAYVDIILFFYHSLIDAKYYLRYLTRRGK